MRHSVSRFPRGSVESPSGERHCASGERVHEALAPGSAWRVRSGAVRLDALGDGGVVFAGLGIPGDIIGAETLLLGMCHFRATALTPTVLTPWPGSASSRGASLLGALAQVQQRGASLVALRAGQAMDRVARLIRLLVPESGGESLIQIVLPPLRDMADITDLTIETVSRSLSNLRRLGMLEPDGQRRGRGDKTCLYLAPEMVAMT